MHPLLEILGTPDPFLDRLFAQLKSKGINTDSIYMDHICYRVAHLEDYHSIQSELLHHGSLLSDKIIGGRPISVVQLHEPYHYNNRQVDVIELPSPKEGSHYTKGYEHVEFVVEVSLEDFINTNNALDFDLKGMQKATNRDIRLALDGCAVKFHEHSLKYVIEVLEH